MQRSRRMRRDEEVKRRSSQVEEDRHEKVEEVKRRSCSISTGHEDFLFLLLLDFEPLPTESFFSPPEFQLAAAVVADDATLCLRPAGRSLLAQGLFVVKN